MRRPFSSPRMSPLSLYLASTSRIWWPPNWFLGRSPAAAILRGLAARVRHPHLCLSYHRYQRLLIETPGPNSARGLVVARAGSSLRDPHEQAMFSFLWKTLRRSRLHRLMLQVCAGLALAWMIGAGDLWHEYPFPSSWSRWRSRYSPSRAYAICSPFPAELRANWLFQITESEGRVGLAARRGPLRDRLCAGARCMPAVFPAAISVFGLWQAIRVTVLGLFFALVVFEFLFRDWRKAPFTCSYLPGKRQLWQVLVAGLGALSYIGTATVAIAAFSRGWVTFAAAFPLLFGAWRWMHQRRTGHWPETALLYEELLEPASVIAAYRFRARIAALARSPPSSLKTRPRLSGIRRVEDSAIPRPSFAPPVWLDDLRYSVRVSARTSALAATIVATLTLGIGMNVSVFTLLNAVAFRATRSRSRHLRPYLASA